MSIYKTYTTMAGKDENEFDPTTMVEVNKIISLENRKNIIQTNKVVVIDNYTDWCGPCKACAPQFSTLAKKYGKPGLCAFVKEDVDKEFDVPVPITGVPCFHFYINGHFQAQMTVTGADVALVEQTVQNLLR